MKTSHNNQTMGMNMNTAPDQTNKNRTARIGDDDGISNRTMNMLIVLFTIITIIVSVGSSIGQEGVKYRILLRQAMLDMDRLEYGKALEKLLEVRSNTEDNANVNYMLGICYLHRPGATEQAAFYLNRAVPFASDEYEEWDLDETNAPSQVAYYLATAYEQLEEYEKAAEFYDQFLTSMQPPGKPNTSRTFAIISSKAEQCKLATAKQTADVEYKNVVLNK